MHSRTTAKKHFVEEFMSLLNGLLSNIEKAKKLRDRNADDHLLEFFNVQLAGNLNSGKHQVFVDSAAECEAETKVKLRACGKKFNNWFRLGGRMQSPQLLLNYRNAARTSGPSAKRNG